MIKTQSGLKFQHIGRDSGKRHMSQQLKQTNIRKVATHGLRAGLLVLSLCMALVSSVTAHPKPSPHRAKFLSLREAILLGMRYNPNIKNNEIDRVIQKFDLRLAYNKFELQYALTGNASLTQSRIGNVRQKNVQTYNLIPEASLKTGLGTSFKVSVPQNEDAYVYRPHVQLQVNQPLLRGFGVAVNEASLNNSIDGETINQLSLKQNVINQVTTIIQDYYTVIESNYSVQTARRSLKEAREVVTNNKALIKAGRLAPTVNVQANAQVQSLKLSLIEAENARDQAKQTLLQQIGLNPNMKIRLPHNVDIGSTQLPQTKQAIDTALRQNTAYKTALINFRQNQRDYVVAKNDQRWQLDAQATASYGGSIDDDNDHGVQSIVNGRNYRQSVGLNLSIPIHDLSRQKELLSSRLTLDKDKINLAADKRKLIGQVKNQMTELKNKLRQVRIGYLSVKLAKQNYMLERKKQAYGRASALDVTNSQNALIQAQIRLIANKIAYLNAKANLQSMLGATLKAWSIQLQDG
jgi:outer membrane protein